MDVSLVAVDPRSSRNRRVELVAALLAATTVFGLVIIATISSSDEPSGGKGRTSVQALRGSVENLAVRALHHVR